MADPEAQDQDLNAAPVEDKSTEESSAMTKIIKGILIGQWVLLGALLFTEANARKNHGMMLLNPVIAVVLAPAAAFCWF